MALFGGVTLPGHPDLANVALLDRLPVPMMRRMMRYGMMVDREYLWGLAAGFRTEQAELAKDIASYIPPARLGEFMGKADAAEAEDDRFNPGSSEQVASLLFDVLGIGKQQSLRRTPKGDRFSTGKRQLELVRAEHPIIPKVLRYREVSKLENTYASKLPASARFHPRNHDGSCPICEMSHESDMWRVHGDLGTTRAATGRINHSHPNLGNIPTRTDDGQAVQAGFIAPPGFRIATRDLKGIELRNFAHLAKLRNMIRSFLTGGDPHDDTARLAFNLRPDEKPDKIKHRMAAKRTNFSIQNGTTEYGLFLQLVMDYGTSGLVVPEWLTKDWCKWFIAQWLEAQPEAVEYFHLTHFRGWRYGITWDPFGRVRLVPELKSQHSWIREAGLRQAQNMPITSMAAGQLKLAMAKTEMMLLELMEQDVWSWPLMTIHDALMVECREEDAKLVNEAMAWGMDTCMTDEDSGECLCRVPIESDGLISERWVK